MNFKLITITTLLLIPLAGCATITRGSSEALVVESDPSGATVNLSNGMTGTTPTSFKVKRKESLTATISKQGYETAKVNITPQISRQGGTAMAGNLLFGGIIGAAVDASSGAMNELKPNPVKVTLNRQ